MSSGSQESTARRSLSPRQDIINVILSRGSLSKDDIKLMWGLDEEAYAQLKVDLAKEKLLEPGPRGSGGFVATFSHRPKPAKEQPGADEVFEAGWERETVQRLGLLLGHAELESLLGDLVYTLRRARAQATGEDRRGTKSELAAALVIQHGIDLFAVGHVRKLIGKKLKVEPPGRWHPGKGAALHFVEATAFPEELAGIPSEDSPPDFEYLEGRADLKPLQAFQLEVQRKLLSVMQDKGGRAILTLPTGAGKTRVAVDSIRDWLADGPSGRAAGSRSATLWLAHTEELCEQAYECFREVWQASPGARPVLLFRFWGSYTRDLGLYRDTLTNSSLPSMILVSTPHRLVSLLDDRVDGSAEVTSALRSLTSLVVIDEAHRAAAPSYRRIVKHFGGAPHTPCVIGLTATPFRHEYDASDPNAGTRDLRELFGKIIEPLETVGRDARGALEKEGFLARPVWSEIKTSTRLIAPDIAGDDELTDDDIERIDFALKIRADNPARRMLVLERVLQICADPGAQIIYFGPSVRDAECMAFLLRQQGVAAAFVCGATRDVSRRKIVGDFKTGVVKVLCNCEVLTTGFDAPKVTHVVMARPTVSQVLYEQMIGRGLRGPRFGGTETCEIVDLEDKYRVDKLSLGYQQFRALWLSRGRSRTT
jgi:DNA repair protein RadD